MILRYLPYNESKRIKTRCESKILHKNHTNLLHTVSFEMIHNLVPVDSIHSLADNSK